MKADIFWLLTKPKEGLRLKAFLEFGSPARTRTTDPMINSHLLYQLSYRGMQVFRAGILGQPKS